MNPFETIYLDGMKLPNHTQLNEITKPNAAEDRTLDGTLTVDFYNVKRTWEISWDLLSLADYNSIKAKFDKQFSQQVFLPLHIENLDLYGPVYMRISTRNVRLNGQWVENFTITLEEQDAIS